MPARNKVTISVRLEPALAKRVKKLAKKADRSASKLIARMLEDRIDIEESHIDAILEGEAAARRGEGQDLEQVAAEIAARQRGKRRARKAG
ncbi:MAG: ribbon-helix-helix protein, CopG family [Planctomycetes bacterium]|nr:ribbon-helix-helix protein, CopG family [Planctomycetota bacterium]